MGVVQSVVYSKAFTRDELTLKTPPEVSSSAKSWHPNLAVCRLRQRSAINGQTRKLQGQVNYDVSPSHLPHRNFKSPPSFLSALSTSSAATSAFVCSAQQENAPQLAYPHSIEEPITHSQRHILLHHCHNGKSYRERSRPEHGTLRRLRLPANPIR